ncbi:MAG: hypothetical protein K2P81_00930 [Bacteriovoracaceae bacterium]|nr:hypothetical protein [Bacteriovoracaceae bacterium]
MKNLMISLIVLSASAFAHATTMTVLETNLPVTRGFQSVDTKFYIDTDMKEGFAKVAVSEQITVYVQECNYGGGYGGGYPIPGRGGYGGGYPGPIPYCRTIPQTQYRSILTDKVKIEGMTMNGDDVIFQGAEGDVVCGTMKKSRVFRVPTLYLSGKCDLNGTIRNNMLTVTFRTK